MKNKVVKNGWEYIVKKDSDKMMKIFKTKKAMIKFFLFIFMIFGIVPACKVQAAAPKIEKSYKVWLYNGTEGTEQSDQVYSKSIYISNLTKNGKITKLENSNPSVADVSVSQYGKNSVVVKAKSEGTAKLTFQYAGKKLSTKIVVEKWDSPCEMFKIGNKDYASYFERSERYCLGNRKKDISAKIKIKPKNGWKLIKINSYASKLKQKKIRNNSKMRLSIKGLYTQVEVYFKNKKTGEQRKLIFLYSDSTVWRNGNVFNWD